LPTISWVATETMAVSGLKLEQTKPCLPSGEKMVIPGPFASLMRLFSEKDLPSSTAT